MKTRVITVLVTLISLSAALAPIAEASGRWG